MIFFNKDKLNDFDIEMFENNYKHSLYEYDIETAEDIQDALKDLLGGTIKEMMEAEMDDHLGYHKSERSESDDYRNGYKTKRINSSFGSLDIQVLISFNVILLQELLDDLTFSVCHLNFVYVFLFSCHNKGLLKIFIFYLRRPQ